MRDLKPYARHDGAGWLRDLLLLAVVLGVPFLQFLGGIPLIDPDEGRYAEIPREMLERGDLITPTLNYVNYFEKPPLLYWVNAASLKLFGLNEFAARLPSALAGLLTVLVTYVVARELYGRRSAVISALVLGTAAGFVLQSRIILTDMLLTLCLTAALGAAAVAVRREGRRSRALPWYLFYACSALAVLAKGLIGLVFPAGILLGYIVLARRWRLLSDARPFTGLLLLLAVAAPWFIAVSLRNPEFARFFFIHEHFERFTSTVHGRYQPFWFFVPVLIGTMLPWSFFIPGAMADAWRDRRHEEGRSGLFLLVWVLLIFLFFSKSSSKLVPYILPVFPPLAIMIGHRLGRLTAGGRHSGTAAALLGVTLTLLGAGAFGYAFVPQLAARLADIVPSWSIPLNQFVRNAPAVPAAVSMTVGGLFLFQGLGTLLTAGRSVSIMLAILCAGSLLLEIVIPRGVMPVIAASESPRELALKAAGLAGPDTHIVTDGPMQAVSWYARRRVMVTGKPDELEFGSRIGDNAAWFPDRKALAELWHTGHVLLLIKPRDLETVQPFLKPAPIIKAEAGRKVLVSNR